MEDRETEAERGIARKRHKDGGEDKKTETEKRNIATETDRQSQTD